MSIVNVEPETSHHSGSSGPRASACKGIPGYVYVSCRTCQTGCPTVRSILAAPAATIAPCCPTLRPRHSAKENALLNLQIALEDNVTPTHGTSRSICGFRLSTAPGDKTITMHLVPPHTSRMVQVDGERSSLPTHSSQQLAP